MTLQVVQAPVLLDNYVGTFLTILTSFSMSSRPRQTSHVLPPSNVSVVTIFFTLVSLCNFKYCQFPPIDRSTFTCSPAFKDGALQITTAEALRPVGGIGATDVVGTDVMMKFCCQNQDPSYMAVDLPNGHAFMWLAYNSCPDVRGELWYFVCAQRGLECCNVHLYL